MRSLGLDSSARAVDSASLNKERSFDSFRIHNSPFVLFGRGRTDECCCCCCCSSCVYQQVQRFPAAENCDNLARTYYMSAYSLHACIRVVFRRPKRRVRVRAFATPPRLRIYEVINEKGIFCLPSSIEQFICPLVPC